jgi:NADPH2:quinone reductase
MMKAIRVHSIGGPEALIYEDIAKPEPGSGEARVNIEASGVNYIDTYQRSGLYKVPLPFTLGQEAAGTVDAVGAGVAEVKPGDRVAYASALGAYAEYAIVPAWRLVPVPQGVSTQQAAAVMLQGMTAHYLACDTFPLKPGDTALVHAAAGGVGLLLVQVAKMRGARVIGTVSTEDKARLAKQVCADEVILYTQQDFEAEVKRLTNDKGVNVVYDSVGKDTFDKSLNCIKPRGYMVLFGASSGAVPPLDPQVLNAKGSLFLTRPMLAHYTADRAELLKRANDLFEWMRAGKLHVRVDRTFPLADAATAHRHLESRQSMGKLLLIP